MMFHVELKTEIYYLLLNNKKLKIHLCALTVCLICFEVVSQLLLLLGLWYDSMMIIKLYNCVLSASVCACVCVHADYWHWPVWGIRAD